uniref:DUF4982 domain-containing protein n=1 Tax=Agathobacter rectalis TaxID=39491 RepID=UPI0040259A61
MQCHNFNEDWTFEKADQADRLKAFYRNCNAVAVTLPHDAMIREKRDKGCPSGAQSGFYPGGVYTYEKKFMAQNEWKKQDVFLEFEGIYGIARVWINGSLAAVNRNGYMGFSVDLKPWISYEHENIIRIDVDNSKQPNSRWYSGSGIYRDVNLRTGKGVYISHDKLRITTLSVNDDMAVLEVCAQLKNIIGHGLEAECLIEIKKDGQKAASNTQRVVFRSEQMQTVRVQIPIEQPKKWSPAQPVLYECHITTRCDDEICDEAVSNFGIRVLALDPVHGLQINGETVKLRGTCIHHDNGVIGAETFKEAEWYRCKRLKEAGFNAIRSAHHPMSRAMLDACDHIGMLVMDELTDMWDKEKNTYDFSDIFEDEYNQWINHMVEKDYNHPSVIIYSVGNEIQEAGTKQGAWINRMLCNKFHELDNTRYTTNALNGLNCAGRRLGFIMRDVAEKFGMDSHGSGSGGGSNALNSFMSLMSGEKGEFFAKHPLVSEALEECSQSCDITGLNYLSGRYELEHELHPAKTVLGTETYPADIENLWKLVETYPHVIGDFTWTGYDYIGEAGVGIFHYDGNANFTSIYPERLGYIGDIDLIGNRRPISYFREIVYGLTDKPYIAVERLEHTGQTAGKTAWMFKDNISSWTWKGFEGTTANVDVYSSGDEVELFLNDKSLGRKPAGRENHFTASYEVPYEPGTLKAVAYQKDRKLGEYELSTAKSVTKLKVCRVTENERNIAYIKIWLVDDNGTINSQEAEKRLLHASVVGNGVLEGFGTANPSSEEDYFSDSVTTFDGSALAAVRWKDVKSKEPAVLKVWTDDGCQVMINIENN